MKYRLAHLLTPIFTFPFLLIWRLLGWKIETPFPDQDKVILTAAPHTSNWDYYHVLMAASNLNRKPFATVKDSLFVGPLGWILRLFGGIPINRSKSSNMVQQLSSWISKEDRMLLLFTPEGTRNKSPHWRTGFYYVALEANVPVVCAYIDYRRKRIGFSEAILMTGDIEADFEKIFSVYGQYGYPLYPEKWTPLQLNPDKKSELVPKAS